MTTLQETYNEYYTNVKRMLKALNKAVKTHSKKQKKEPHNWGYVGDIAHISQELNDLQHFINSNLSI